VSGDPIPYAPRRCQFLDIWELGDWQLKVYGIVYDDAPLSPELVAAARQLAEERLALSAEQTGHYKVGFVGIHQGKTSHFVFVDWWADSNELHHHVYVAPLDAPTAFSYTSPSGLIACVWDLELMAFERKAWVHTAMSPQGDIAAYLNRHFNGDL
tara:strand:+ start:18404 stop:18868 length:465 start_codon:yes stop_codon:yes gene_type:complete